MKTNNLTMANPKISIIIPVYNVEQYIRKLIDSILVQTFEDFELLLINDGAKDSTPQILDEYAREDHRVIVIHKDNGGVSSARNVGLENAKGTYIAFADSDDYMYPDNLQTMVEEIQDYDLLICEWVRCRREQIGEFDKTRKKQNFKEISGRGDTLSNAIKNKGYKDASVWNQLFVHDIIERNNIRFENTQGEDELFCYQYQEHINSLKKIDYQGYAYIYTSNSLSGTHQCIAEIDWIRKMENIYDNIITKYDIFGGDLSTYTWRIANRLAVLCLKGYYKESHKSYRERISVWRDVRNDEWFKRRINPAEVGRMKQSILLIAKYRLFYILEPLFIIYGKTHSI